ncbi:thiamine transporter 2-like isoform X2 [Adelges cooleyi]|nr:thiamine transporter 2-like isoform X2 [Adelges cooleyi]XP_050427128.1 thiamine transporter 2-like isoform X2 [Adelges cooleyi]XP_050427129.1 thiamine transporter 2-like isoform X2 [Adelges cooleyi]
MEDWIKVTLFLCTFAFFRDFRPVDPFYTAYLTSPAVNFTTTQITEEIYPWNAYACTSVTIFVFLVTDFVRYKPIVILDALSSMVMYCLVMKPVTLFKAQLALALTGLSSATELAYVSYIYAKVKNRALYQKMTGFLRAAYLLGRCVSATVSQIAVSYFDIDYNTLVYLSLAGSTMAFIFSFFLPTVKGSIYFYPEQTTEINKEMDYKSIDTTSNKSKKYFKPAPKSRPVVVVLNQLYLELKDTYSNPYLLKYLIWSSVSTGVFMQVLTYNDVVFSNLNKLDPVNNKLYNGGVDAIAFIVGAFASYGLSYLNLQWKRISNLCLFFGALLNCIVLTVYSMTSTLNLVYFMYFIYMLIFNVMYIIARSETAKYLQHESFAFIIGLNYFAALCVSSFLTMVIVQGTIFEISISSQYYIYALINGGLAVWFLISLFVQNNDY